MRTSRARRKITGLEQARLRCGWRYLQRRALRYLRRSSRHSRWSISLVEVQPPRRRLCRDESARMVRTRLRDGRHDHCIGYHSRVPCLGIDQVGARTARGQHASRCVHHCLGSRRQRTSALGSAGAKRDTATGTPCLIGAVCCATSRTVHFASLQLPCATLSFRGEALSSPESKALTMRQ